MEQEAGEKQSAAGAGSKKRKMIAQRAGGGDARDAMEAEWASVLGAIEPRNVGASARRRGCKKDGSGVRPEVGTAFRGETG